MASDMGGFMAAGRPRNTPNSGFPGVPSLRIPPNVANVNNAAYPLRPYVPMGDMGGFPRPVADPYFDKVSLLIHGDGVDASTAFADTSKNALPVTNSGGVVSTLYPLFGNVSGSAYLNGSANLKVAQSYSSLFGFGSSDFTVEFYARHDSITAIGEYLNLRDDASDPNNFWILRFGDTGYVRFVAKAGGVSVVDYQTANGVVGGGLWFHVCVERFGNVFTTYVQGAPLASASYSGSINSPANAFFIGVESVGTGRFLGRMAELRITKGVARYKGAFVVPLYAFPDF